MKKQQKPKPPEQTKKRPVPDIPAQKKLTRSEINKEWHHSPIYKPRKKRKRPYIPGTTRNKRESQRILDAFEYYYGLGDNRNLAQVAVYFKVNPKTAREWSRSFNWLMRVEQRDVEINRQLQRKLINSIVKTKAEYRKDLQLAYGLVKHTIAKSIQSVQSGQVLKADDSGDIYTLMNAMDKIIRLDMNLLGEDNSNLTGITQTFAEFAATLTEKWKAEGKTINNGNGKNGNGGNGKNGKSKNGDGETPA